MKKLFAGLALAVGLVLVTTASPAGANVIINPSLNCERVTFSYKDFPTDPVSLYVEVKMMGGEGAIYSGNVQTTGKEGDIKIPIEIPVNGDARLFIQWFIDKEHHLVQHFQVKCAPVETTTTSVATTTTTKPVPPTTVVTTPSSSVPSVPPTAPPNENSNSPGPSMPDTGADTLWVTLIGVLALAGGLAILMRGRDEVHQD